MDDRIQRLHRHFESIIHGRVPLTPKNGNLFIEAVCAEPDPPSCISKLISSKSGVASIQNVMRFDLSASFCSGPATSLIQYIQAPELHNIGGGRFLQQIITSIVEPPFFWDAFVQAYRSDKLSESGKHSFAWLLLQVISFDPSSSALDIAQDEDIMGKILRASQAETRMIGHKIRAILDRIRTGTLDDSDDYGPGGRHDNDFVDFRQIAILPTADELVAKDPPFLRPRTALVELPELQRLQAHLDNQFRLLREDLLYEIRDELQIALGQKKGRHRGLVFEGFDLGDLYDDKDNKGKWALTFQYRGDFWQYKKAQGHAARLKYLKDNPKFLRHQSVICLVVDEEIVAFPYLNRNEDLLSRRPPVLTLQFEGKASTVKALLRLKNSTSIKMIQTDAAIFAVEPILTALQQKTCAPLLSDLVSCNDHIIPCDPDTLSPSITAIARDVRRSSGQDLQTLLQTRQPVILDSAQAASLVSGLTQKVSLIQGPPGTGKSFIGALLTKIIHDRSAQTILVVCYTNHALDQFLEDLLDAGLPPRNMVRLGSKSTPRTEALSLHSQNSTYRLGKAEWQSINSLDIEARSCRESMSTIFTRYKNTAINHTSILGWIEFEAPEYFDAFLVPTSSDGMMLANSRGRPITKAYLLSRWMWGHDAGIFSSQPTVQNAPSIWSMLKKDRQAKIAEWTSAILEEQVVGFQEVAAQYNECRTKREGFFSQHAAEILRSKRIIGCTTTAAAKYSDSIRQASPDVLMVEEAGEILESHIIAALSANTEQLIMIGDHKQLRPKVNNYALTVEKGNDYDLNMSLFERLIVEGYPHSTLRRQHRMRPEISDLIRQLTYPDLLDAKRTKNRADIRGLRDNIIFLQHGHPEDEVTELADQRDGGSASSKQNSYEAEMILKIVRYLAQQGYGTDKIVVLTPYLGQLRKLQEALKTDNDPVLSDIDSYDLVRAGLVPSATATTLKKPIRLATIDNYQGEESDIVVASLTRSNTSNEIGFMSSPQRLNVLLSRARDGLIILGNAETFFNARKGGEIWAQFIGLLKQGRHIYDGLPIRCERHPDQIANPSRPMDFDSECPDGGCKSACAVILSCGVHACPSRCHQLVDHSKMRCEAFIPSTCSQGHDQSRRCYQVPVSICEKCKKEAELAEKKRQKAFALQKKREDEQNVHLKELAEIDAKIALERQRIQDLQSTKEREAAIRQKKQELAHLEARGQPSTSASDVTSTPDGTSTGESTIQGPTTSQDGSLSHTHEEVVEITASFLPNPAQKPNLVVSDAISTESMSCSASQREWRRRKEMNGASNDAVDALMDMIGLEKVKEQVLTVMDKIDVSKRRNSSLKSERFNTVLLGNPGTGKTTVARHYAKFLTDFEILPGSAFFETTGSRLANEGVPGIKKLIQDTKNAGGGAIFVDEAYQLANQGGSQVLDFLLAEMENNVGTIVFILAGYNKQMEKFFEHNPGLTSRVPYTMQFADYNDSELMLMLEQLIIKRFDGKMKVEDGIKGLYGRITVRRLGRGRGREGFGNARALHNLFAKISERQAARISKERRIGGFPDDYALLKEDLIGPDPSKVIKESKAWTRLQSLTGLDAVKQSIRSLFDLIQINYQRELGEKEPLQMTFNRVFCGSPGTGKTTVAKLYGQILADFGFLSNGEVMVKNPADFVGSALGESEKNTKGIIAASEGKVLIIDEAYMLYGGTGDGSAQQNDPYKTAVIDTIVAEIQNVPGEDRCVLLLGYKDQMTEMFQNVNPGLSRRFSIEQAFHFEDFTDADLRKILDSKLKDGDLGATDAAKNVAIEVLGRLRNRPNFGNAGEVENLLGQAKLRYQARQAQLPARKRSFDVIFEPADFDPDFDRDASASANLTKLFEDVVGHQGVVDKLREYQQTAQFMKSRGMDPRSQVPTNFVFKGPPGTGKTTIARKMGQVFYDMGFLSSAEVIETSASDLVGQFVGQTGPKTRKLFEKALGRVLFIDEAYRLGEGPFAKEAIDELVGLLTQEKFISKVVVILAGYDEDMNRLLAINSGLSSRFPEEFIFRNMQAWECLEVLERDLKKKGITSSALSDRSSEGRKQMEELIEELSTLPSWGNARDMKTLAKNMTSVVFSRQLDSASAHDQLELDGKDALACIADMLRGKQQRNAISLSSPKPISSLMDLALQTAVPPPRNSVRIAQNTKTISKPAEQIAMQTEDGRDVGVADTIWLQLQADKEAQEKAQEMAEDALRALEDRLQQATKSEKDQQVLLRRLAKVALKDTSEDDELRRKRELERIKQLSIRAERERLAKELEARREEERRMKREEAKAQAKLRDMGVCPVGFRWIKQEGGYRCAGGAHFVTNGQLGI